MDEFLKRLGDHFTPAELVELVALSMPDLLGLLEDLDFFDDDTVAELEEIMDGAG